MPLTTRLDRCCPDLLVNASLMLNSFVLFFLRRSYSWLRGSRPPPFTSLVSILDLDPKPFDSILYQLRLDQTIVSFYLKSRSALPEDSVSSHPAIRTAPDRDDCTLLFHPV